MMDLDWLRLNYFYSSRAKWSQNIKAYLIELYLFVVIKFIVIVPICEMNDSKWW